MSNQVKFFIYKTIKGVMKKEDINQLTQLAWKAAQTRQMHPTKILIRSGAHNTTMGRLDPDGMHYTICFKDRDTEKRKTHIAYHAYVKEKGSYVPVKETFANEKSDSTPRGHKGEVVWDESKIEEIHDVVYGAGPSPSQPSSSGGRTTTLSSSAAKMPASKPPSKPASKPPSKPASKPPSKPGSSGKGAKK